MRKLIVSEWMSLDGVFDAQAMGDWWGPYDSDERAAHIQGEIGSAGAFVLGRRTYEMLAPYWSAMQNNEMGVAANLNGAPKYVVSSTLETASWNNTTIIKRDVSKELEKLKQQAGGPLLVMGSAELVRSLSGDSLIDEYRFLVTPVVMGRGRRFFDDQTGTTKLTLTNSKTLKSGVLALSYTPAAR
ncbi:MAG: dihydrofolate reductase family protein [Polyangia bacterium]